MVAFTDQEGGNRVHAVLGSTEDNRLSLERSLVQLAEVIIEFRIRNFGHELINPLECQGLSVFDQNFFLIFHLMQLKSF